MFDERVVPIELQHKLINYYYNNLGKAINIGYSNNLEHFDTVLSENLHTNILEFSAFKEASFRNSLTELITNNKNLPTWSEFKKKALETSKLYNVNWLNSEYHQTVATANMAGKWQSFQTTKELYPNLKYITVGDKKVRDKHKKWDGFIAPISHPIWKKLLPPNDWGCRCDIIPTDENPTDGYTNFIPKVKEEFANNPAISGKVFTKSSYETSLSKDLKKEAKTNISEYIRNSNNIIKSKHKKLNIELGSDNNDLKRNYEVAAALVNDLDINILIKKHDNTIGVKNPEYLINNKYLGDRKSIKGYDGIIWQIDSSKKQMMHISVNPNKLPYYIIWDLDLIENLEIEKVIQNLKKKITKERGRNIKGMLFYYKNKVFELSREEIVARDFTKIKNF
ncbi:phage head morphogenesis protein [Tenacibaculum salmonis]|uniref:phage head morphogenesis protein n=1 Tax=Tenacibaculum sp. P3-BQ1 TaxID=3232310 RepID=UPI0034DF1211